MPPASSPPTRPAADLAATGAIGAISLRAFTVAGALPGHPDRDKTRLIPQLLALQQGHAPELVINGDGTAVRDFVHVAEHGHRVRPRPARVRAGRLARLQRRQRPLQHRA
ncbi:MAG: NAD-dependent epimerase/dehydratase family protein [Pseudonocardiales bacterium]|nr:NAD-dependent epimerase/dehydratase family protein [Pseudonocardiales bacterium]MBV9032595.1 NAD-dependent epimerase/dehydratase family protein [Pseudonocardiales bacterium]MBW0010538.1 NAD-dependent epimerase/dehydratase family protein [Pseudonocardiales bacterium]